MQEPGPVPPARMHRYCAVKGPLGFKYRRSNDSNSHTRTRNKTPVPASSSLVAAKERFEPKAPVDIPTCTARSVQHERKIAQMHGTTTFKIVRTHPTTAHSCTRSRMAIALVIDDGMYSTTRNWETVLVGGGSFGFWERLLCKTPWGPGPGKEGAGRLPFPEPRDLKHGGIPLFSCRTAGTGT